MVKVQKTFNPMPIGLFGMNAVVMLIDRISETLLESLR
ncbi:hypothetical protein VCRA2126O85_20005 [Vibrio crassostreae]|nr:hypothetical protein VCRA2127O91_20006 [Vibrio crassostreae]CAK2819819.1 hypothetical protein VCRA2126O86_20005 [Vibrio crassostreae]CAK2823950.1 hypothetical protein VCRA2126O85_20005 [Vibrio crassostreae]CAK2825720.1 hypothetical protein VCRA2125O83_20006 [Vibrio crassostreae]CAK2918496.1 hypothetical protein VCRA2126O84_30005 [Vibrio crassostreae]